MEQLNQLHTELTNVIQQYNQLRDPKTDKRAKAYRDYKKSRTTLFNRAKQLRDQIRVAEFHYQSQNADPRVMRAIIPPRQQELQISRQFRFGSQRKDNVQVNNLKPATVRSLFENVRFALTRYETPLQVILMYVNSEGLRQYKTLDVDAFNVVNFEDFETIFNDLIAGNQQTGSDPIADDSRCFSNMFTIVTRDFAQNQSKFGGTDFYKKYQNLLYFHLQEDPRDDCFEFVKQFNIKTQVNCTESNEDELINMLAKQMKKVKKTVIKKILNRVVETSTDAYQCKQMELDEKFIIGYSQDGWSHVVLVEGIREHLLIKEGCQMTLLGYGKPYKNFYNNQQSALFQGTYDLANSETYDGKNDCETILKNIFYFEKCFVFFDYETVYDINENMFIKPYALSAVIYQVHDSKFKKQDPEYFEFKEFFFSFGVQHDVTDDLFTVLKKISDHRKTLFVLCGYNSSKFDNYILCQYAQKHELLNNIQFVNDSILNFDIAHMKAFDLCRILNSSLKNACKEFKTTYQKIDGFDHNVIQKLYIENKLEEYFGTAKLTIGPKDFINNAYKGDLTTFMNETAINQNSAMKKLIEYNIMDCLSLAELYFKTDKQLFEIKKTILGTDVEEIAEEWTKHDYLTKFKTIGSYIYKIFKQDCKQKNIEFPQFNQHLTKDGLTKERSQSRLVELYQQTRGSLVAGRTQVFWTQRGNKKVVQISNQPMEMVDVVSLYPSQMLSENNFNLGKIVFCPGQEFLKLNREYIGFFDCTFDQQNLDKNILPLRTGDQPLDWNYKGEQTYYKLNSVDIYQLIDNGCNVKLGDGYYFSGTITGKKLFGCLDILAQEKNLQDGLKNIDKDLCNSVKRNLAKLGMNNLSGKIIERIHLEKYKLVNQTQFNKMEKVNQTTVEVFPDKHKLKDLQILHIFGAKALVKKTVTLEGEFKKQFRPLWWGILIYAYARRHCYNSFIKNYNILYTDTDSGLFLKEDAEKIQKDQPEMFARRQVYIDTELKKIVPEPSVNTKETQLKILGTLDFEDKLLNKATNALLLAPKNYFIWGEKLLKSGFKSIKFDLENNRSDIIIPNIKSFCANFKVTGKQYQQIIDFNCEECLLIDPDKHICQICEQHQSALEITKYQALYQDQQYLFEQYSTGLKLISEQGFKMFLHQIQENGCVSVLTSQIKKIKTSPDIDSVQLQQVYMIKQIKTTQDEHVNVLDQNQ